MKKFKTILIILLLLIIPNIINAKEINIYLFYGSTCPHCKQEEEFLETFTKENEVKLYSYEIWNDEENYNKYLEVKKILNDNNQSGVPYLIIGNNVISGYTKGITDTQIEKIYKYYKNIPYEDKVGEYLGIKQNNNNSDLNKIPKVLSSILLGFKNSIMIGSLIVLLILQILLITIKKLINKKILFISIMIPLITMLFTFLISIYSLDKIINYLIIIYVTIAFILIIIAITLLLQYLRVRFSNKKLQKKKILIKIKNISYLIIFIILSILISIILILDTIDIISEFKTIIYESKMILKIIYSILYTISFSLIYLILSFYNIKHIKINKPVLYVISGLLLGFISLYYVISLF